MGMLENLIISAVIEDTAGTLKADAGDGSDCLKFTKNTKPPTVGKKFIDNPEYTGTLGASRGFIGPDEGGFSLEMLLRGSGYYDTAPPCGILLKACGFEEVISTGGVVAGTPTVNGCTVTGSDLEVNDIVLVDVSVDASGNYEKTRITSVSGEVVTWSPAVSAAPTAANAVLAMPTYKTTSTRTNHKSLSIYHYNDGVKISQAGCRGTAKFDFKWAEVAMVTFDFTPLTWAAATADYATTPDFSSLQKAFPVMGGIFNVGGTAKYIESLSLDMAQEVPALGAVQATGYYQNFMGARNPKGTFDPFADTADILTAFRAGTLAEIWMEAGEASNADNEVVMVLPNCQYESVDFADREGVNSYGVGFGAYETSGDDDVILAFCSETAAP